MLSSFLRCALTGIALSLVLCQSSFATTVGQTPITWPSGYSGPAAHCAANAAFLVNLNYGYPTVYECQPNGGGANYRYSMTPVCPTGYDADFSKVLCVPRDGIYVSESWFGSMRALFILFSIVLTGFIGYRQGRSGG